jgi:hypothetical protein
MFKPEDGKKLVELYNLAWNTLGALIRSLRQKKIDDSWDRSLGAIKEDQEAYDV